MQYFQGHYRDSRLFLFFSKLLIDPVFSPATEYIYTHVRMHTTHKYFLLFLFFFYLFCFYFFTRKKDRIILSASCLTRKCICLLRYNNNHINISNFFLKQNFFHNSRSIFFFIVRLNNAQIRAQCVFPIHVYFLIYFFEQFLSFRLERTISKKYYRG